MNSPCSYFAIAANPPWSSHTNNAVTRPTGKYWWEGLNPLIPCGRKKNLEEAGATQKQPQEEVDADVEGRGAQLQPVTQEKKTGFYFKLQQPPLPGKVEEQQQPEKSRMIRYLVAVDAKDMDRDGFKVEVETVGRNERGVDYYWRKVRCLGRGRNLGRDWQGRRGWRGQQWPWPPPPTPTQLKQQQYQEFGSGEFYLRLGRV